MDRRCDWVDGFHRRDAVPFGNVLPALALMLIGLGLVFRDGVAVVLGLAMAALAMFVTSGVMLMAWAWGSEWLLGLF